MVFKEDLEQMQQDTVDTKFSSLRILIYASEQKLAEGSSDDSHSAAIVASMPNAQTVQEDRELLEESFPGVSRNYLYREEDFFPIIKNAVALNDGACFYGSKGNIVVIEGKSFSIGNDLVIGASSSEISSKIDLLEQNFIEVLLKDTNITEHSFLMPLSIKQAGHWALIDLKVKIVADSTNGETKRRFAGDILIKVYDSLPGSKNVGHRLCQQVSDLLNNLLSRYVDSKEEGKITVMPFVAGIQPDVYTCGVLAADTAINIVFGNVQYSEEKITLEDAMQLRSNHIAIADENFQDKQRRNEPEHKLTAVEFTAAADNMAELRNSLYEVIKEDLNFISLATDFSSTDRELHSVLQEVQGGAEGPQYFARMAELDSKDRVNTTKVKEWFAAKHNDLGANILNMFFKPQNGTEELSWCEGGKDTAVAILRGVLALHTIEQSKLNKKRKHEEIGQELKYIYAKNDQVKYSFEGKVNADYEAHGFGFETFNDRCSYMGIFEYGCRIAGTEEYHLENNIVHFYSGSYDSHGKWLKGIANCLVGPETIDDRRVCYKGPIYDGKVSNVGMLSFLGDKADNFAVVLIDGDAITILHTKYDIQDEAVLLRHFRENKHVLHLELYNPFLNRMNTIRGNTISMYCAKRAMDAVFDEPVKALSTSDSASAQSDPILPSYTNTKVAPDFRSIPPTNNEDDSWQIGGYDLR